VILFSYYLILLHKIITFVTYRTLE